VNATQYAMNRERGEQYLLHVHTDTFAIIHTDTCGLDKIESLAVVGTTSAVATTVVDERNERGRIPGNRLTFCGSCVARLKERA
jgi:hypothetical protein